MSRRTRLIALIAGIPALLIVAALIAVYVMLQPQRFTATLRSAANSAGLQLSLAAPAQPSLWPRPGVVLQGVTLTPQDSQSPLLLATRVRLIVPWHTVLGGKTTISALELDAPRLDLASLRHILAQRTPAAATATLPGIDAGITVHNGSLVQNGTLLAKRIELHTGALHPGTPFELSASAHTRSGTGYSLQLHTTPQKMSRRIEFDPLRLTMRSGNGMHMQLHGKAEWAGGAKIQTTLNGNLQRASGQTYTLAMTTTDATPTQPMRLHFKAHGKGFQADLRLPPTKLASWWKQVSGSEGHAHVLSAPPVSGTLQADELQMGSVSIKGLEVRTGADIPAADSSTAKPATPGAPTP